MRAALSVLLFLALSLPASAQDLSPMVIVAGHEGLDATVSSPLSAGRYWVLLGSSGANGVIETPDAASCAAASVAFSLSVPEKPGESPPSDTVHAEAVPWAVLEAWNASPTRRAAFDRVAFQVRPGDAQSVYCVASTSPRLAADANVEQRVTARLVVGDGVARAAEQQAVSRTVRDGSLGQLSPGGRFEFTPQRVMAPIRAQIGILVGSSRQTYGFAGTLMDNTHAVLVAARETDESNWRHPTTSECLATKVEFELRVPEKAGVAPVKTTVSAFWVDAARARALFPDTAQDTYKRVPAHGGVSAFCIAEVPLRLSEVIGLQQVTASVVVTDTSPQVLRGGRREAALPVPNQHFSFRQIRAHARPRPMFGVIASAGGTLSEKATTTPQTQTIVETVPQGDGTTLTTTRIDTVGTATSVDRRQGTLFAGFDFAVEPITGAIRNAYEKTFPRARARPEDTEGTKATDETEGTEETEVSPTRKRRRPPQSTRLVVGTNISGEVGNSVYLGLSTASLFGMIATTSPIDLSLGVAFRREDRDWMVAGAVTLDLGGTLATLREVLTN